MALECPGTQNSLPKSKDSVHNPCEEELTQGQLKSYTHSVISKFSSKKGNQKSVAPKSVTKFLREQETTVASNSKGPSADESSDNSCRSITDLPPALVSEILHCLDAKDLGIVSCVSTLLCKIASDHCGWKEFYCQRWGLPLGPAPPAIGLSNERSWKDLFVEREYRSKSFMGRYSMDVLYGHTEAVRSVFLLAAAKAIFTGGYDSVIRMWDMEEGFSIASSRPLGCTIRAVTADTELLVVGGTDGFLQCWRAIEGYPHLFDITGSVNQNSDFRLWEHEGPVTCLALDFARIYSGSWDMSVRVWDRAQLKCLKVLRHGDWVWDLVPRGPTVASTAGGDVYIWDIESGDRMLLIESIHAGSACSLARSYAGDLLFTGGDDGSVHMFKVANHLMDDDIRPAATWIPHTGAVHSLAFEFPWLVSSSNDGKIALIDVQKVLKSSRASSSRHGDNEVVSKNIEAPQRMLHGFGPNLFSVDIGVDRIVCGGEEGVVRIWNFSQTLEIEQRARAMKGIRLENRMRRRKIQIEMNSKSSRSEQCSAAARRNQMHGDRTSSWHGRRGVNGKLKA